MLAKGPSIQKKKNLHLFQLNVIFLPGKQYQIHSKEEVILYMNLPGKDLEMNDPQAPWAMLMKILVCSQMF